MRCVALISQQFVELAGYFSGWFGEANHPESGDEITLHGEGCISKGNYHNNGAIRLLIIKNSNKFFKNRVFYLVSSVESRKGHDFVRGESNQNLIGRRDN